MAGRIEVINHLIHIDCGSPSERQLYWLFREWSNGILSLNNITTNAVTFWCERGENRLSYFSEHFMGMTEEILDKAGVLAFWVSLTSK